MESEISQIFASFRDYLKEHQELRENIKQVVKNLEESGREIVTILQVVHHSDGLTKIASSCKQCREIIEKHVKPEFKKLGELLKSNSSQYYKYHESWSFITQRMGFIVALINYFESGQLVSHDDVAEALGIESNREKGFHLDLEDYLMGLLQLSSELSRLAVNSVVNGDYNRPFQVSQFVTELNAGFELLNFKNDSLRRKYDGLKYDVKKIEEIVYDLSIRGLKPNKSEE